MRAPRDSLQQQARAISATLPDLVLQADRMATMVAPGGYGLRKAGQGEDFWQYRPAGLGDSASSIDWRRSARSDSHIMRDREAQTAHSVGVWVSAGQGMAYCGVTSSDPKLSRARLLALSLAMVLLRGGERVGLFGHTAGTGKAQADHIAESLIGQTAAPTDDDIAPAGALRPNQLLVLMSDFLDGTDWIADFLARAAGLGVRGVLFQVLDPDEEQFPFTGTMNFQTMSGQASHLSRDAANLQAAYLERLSARRAWLQAQSAASGWRFGSHRTDQPAITALSWLYQTLES